MPLYSQCDFWPDTLNSSQAFSLHLKLREPHPFRFKFIIYTMYSILSSQSYSIFMCWKDLRVGFVLFCLRVDFDRHGSRLKARGYWIENTQNLLLLKFYQIS